MAVEHGSKLSQGRDRDPRAADGNRRAYRGIAHPCRDLTRQTRPDFDVKDLLVTTPLAAIDAKPLTMVRMPGIRDHSKLRSVC